MPTYRTITISLVSQFDIMTIPEYAPPKVPNDPFSEAPVLVDTVKSLVSVYIPTYPSSQFWIYYSIAPPYPPKAVFYFKLFLNGACVVSWGCGERDDYKGRTMFALSDSIQSWMGQPNIGRRAMCFVSPEEAANTVHASNSFEDFMELKVYRSKGRKRIQPILESLGLASGGRIKTLQESVEDLGTVASACGQNDTEEDGNAGIKLVLAGPLPDEHPRRYYQYALIDPIDQPFATFRYYYRTWDELETLGVVSPYPSPTSSVISNSEESGADAIVAIQEPRSTSPEIPTGLAPSPSPVVDEQLHTPAPQETTDYPTKQNPVCTYPPRTSSLSQHSIKLGSLSQQPTRSKTHPQHPKRTSQHPKRDKSISPVLKIFRKPRSRSLPTPSPTQDIFGSLRQRSPSPTKEPLSAAESNTETGSSTPTPSQPSRNGSLKLLREVVQSAMLRRKRSNTVRKSDFETEQVERLLTGDSEQILVGKRRELDVETKLEDHEDNGEEEEEEEEEYAEDDYGSEECEEEQDSDDEAEEEAREIEDRELKEELEEWGEDRNRLGEEWSKTKETNSVEAPDLVKKMDRPFNVWRW